MSQLGGLLSEYGQLSGQTSSQQSFGFGQAAQQTAQQAAQPASDVQPLVMDGGSSSVMVYNGEVINHPYSPTGPRKCPDAWLVR